MGLFDRRHEDLGTQRPVPVDSGGIAADEQALARYRYLLRTAPPEAIEEAHAEAFARLTPEQRQQVLQELGDRIPETERAAAARAGGSPGELARRATRAEIREPGLLERTFGRMNAGPQRSGMGMGGLFAGSLLASMAGTVLGSAIAHQFFDAHPEARDMFGDHRSAPADDTTTLASDDGGGLSDVDGPGGGFDSGFDGGDWV
jgi:hypothetical protein